MAGPSLPLIRLRPGDPAPWFNAPTHRNPRFYFDTAAGRFVVVSLFGSAASPAGQALLALLKAHGDRFDDDNIAFFGVTGDPADLVLRRVVERVPGIRWFQDFDGELAKAFRADDGNGPMHPVAQTIVLDPALRVLAVIPMADAQAHAQALLNVLARLPPIEPDRWSVGPAPVLVIPRIFERAFCRSLIDYYDAKGGFASGHMTSDGGRSVGVLDRSRKRRSDCVIDDDALIKGIQTRLHRRLVPMIQRAFQFNATRIERYIVARYDGAERGFFFPHRDNTSPATKHRRFAVTINLNAEEYEGGELRFPEFGRRSYRAPTGGAVVFSCSLTHEALPVTAGVRYATLPFLYNEEAAEIREATRHLVVPVNHDEAKPPEAKSDEAKSAEANPPEQKSAEPKLAEAGN